MKKYLVSFLFLIFASLQGNLQEFFKPVPFKEPQNSNPIQNVDFAYIINLDQRPEKYENCVKELSPYNIFPCRFSAVNGWELSLETINRLGVPFEPKMKKDLWGTSYLMDGDFQPHHEVMHEIGRNYFCHCMSRGAIGIVLSHLSVLQDAYDSGYNTIWVMEDDIKVIKDPHVLSQLIAELDRAVGKDQWDILFTDRDTKNNKGQYVACGGCARRPNFNPSHPNRFQLNVKVAKDLRRIGARYGAYSMIVRRTGMKKILDFFNKYKIFLPYDMEYPQPNDITLYTVIDDVVSTEIRALSDNGGPNYKNK